MKFNKIIDKIIKTEIDEIEFNKITYLEYPESGFIMHTKTLWAYELEKLNKYEKHLYKKLEDYIFKNITKDSMSIDVGISIVNIDNGIGIRCEFDVGDLYGNLYEYLENDLF